MEPAIAPQKKLFCFGYGYSCDYLGHALQESGQSWKIAGTTRDKHRAEILRNRGIETFIFDREHPLTDIGYQLRDVTHLLISTPPDDDGDPAYLMHGQDIATLLPKLEWAGYLSTTGVYGDRDGAPVDETAEITPTSRRGQRRAKAEEQWHHLFQHDQLPLHIFRLAGIYGPGRSALDSVRAGIARRINKQGHAFGRIHVEDIAGALMASFAHPTPGEAFNLCDGTPAPSHEVIACACELLGRPAPPMIDFEEANLAPMTRSFYMENRRVQNDKLKSMLGYNFKYPDFQSGLKGCLDAELFASQQQGASQAGAPQKPAIFKR